MAFAVGDALVRPFPDVRVQGVFAELLPQAAARYEPDRAAALFQRFRANGAWHVPTLIVPQAAAYSGSVEFPLPP
ncbi:MAG TPA: hypothetical protein VFO16_22970 [Pseudonocardiaceae bacterium]|nr:hypothetical protein [Pseudonocardiaceae bacterium]